jgi:hypothetical protein
MDTYQRLIGRRRFMHCVMGSAVSFSALDGRLGVAHGRQPQPHDAPGVHNMLIVGDQAVFLSHLPMFDRLTSAATDFSSVHRYQVLLEASLTSREKPVNELLVKDRQSHPDTRIYTLGPQEPFVLSSLLVANARERPSFKATVFRGHLEQGGEPVPNLDGVHVTVNRVLHARKFTPQAAKPTELEYIVFGNATELFAAHSIFGPPDFDHVLRAGLTNIKLSENDLNKGVRLVVANRRNVVAERVQEGQEVEGTLRAPGRGVHGAKVRMQVTRELYFEEGELLIPPAFDPTPEEKKGG